MSVFDLNTIPMTLHEEPYFIFLVLTFNLSILWPPLKVRTPQNYTIVNFGHPVSKSWLRPCYRDHLSQQQQQLYLRPIHTLSVTYQDVRQPICDPVTTAVRKYKISLQLVREGLALVSVW